MKYRTLGKTGYKVSEIGFGAWQIGGAHWGSVDDNESIRALNLAIDRGVNFIDTAQGYGNGKSERVIAEVLKNRTERVYVATKVLPLTGHPNPYHGWQDSFPEKYLRENIHERLKMLSTDRIDILLLHSWSRAWNEDPKPLEILQDLKKEGLVENIGISVPPNDQNSVIELIKNERLDVVEFIYNIFNQEAAAELLPASKKHDVGTIIRVPLEEGALTGKYTEDTTFPEGDFRHIYFGGDRMERIVKRAKKIKQDLVDTGLSMVHASLLYILAQDAVGTVIPGMRNEKYVTDNTSVSGMEPLANDTIQRLKVRNWARTTWVNE